MTATREKAPPPPCHWVSEPTEFTAEANGVVWMPIREHLVRLIQGCQSLRPCPLRAEITSVAIDPPATAACTHRSAGLPTVRIRHSLVAYLGRSSPVPSARPVQFRGDARGPLSGPVGLTGTVGSASFNHLKEGNYVFAGTTMAGGTPAPRPTGLHGQPALVSTKLAWALYIASAVGLILLVAWLMSYLECREMVRLERVVAERTGSCMPPTPNLDARSEENLEKTTALAASEDRYRQLNAELRRPRGQTHGRTPAPSTSNCRSPRSPPKPPTAPRALSWPP